MAKKNENVRLFLLEMGSNDSKYSIVHSRSWITNDKVTPTNDCEKKEKKSHLLKICLEGKRGAIILVSIKRKKIERKLERNILFGDNSRISNWR